MSATSIPSIHISPETDGYQHSSSLHYSPSDSDTTNMRAATVPSISQSSEAFDPQPYNAFILEDFIIPGMYDQSQKDDCGGYPSSPFLSDDRGETTDSQLNAFSMRNLRPELCTPPYITGPAGVQPFAHGAMDNNFLLPSPPSPSSSYNGSQSPASVHSELSSDVEYTSAASSVPPEESIMYTSSPCYAGHFSYPYSRHRHTSSESVTTRDLISPPPVLGHHRSHSAPSVPRGRIATQAMLDANARRRVHDPQFTCNECQQTFTAQFSLKRHQRSHTGERLFQCSIPGCGQRFFNSSDCKRHEKSKKRHPNPA